jgi:hypothetical protein
MLQRAKALLGDLPALSHFHAPVRPLESTLQTSKPTLSPTRAPTQAPTEAKKTATDDDDWMDSVTWAPTPLVGTATPTLAPTDQPTRGPTHPPTPAPTQTPTRLPTACPTRKPTTGPTHPLNSEEKKYGRTVADVLGLTTGLVNPFAPAHTQQAKTQRLRVHHFKSSKHAMTTTPTPVVPPTPVPLVDKEFDALLKQAAPATQQPTPSTFEQWKKAELAKHSVKLWKPAKTGGVVYPHSLQDAKAVAAWRDQMQKHGR